jgi:hypothetical protein
MNDRERAVNQDLQILGDAYRLRQIRRDEYRLRRRHVLAGLRARDDVETTRKPLRRAAAVAAAASAQPQPQPAAAGSTAGSPRAGVAWKYWLLFGFGLLVVAAVAWLLLRSPDELGATTRQPATTVASLDRADGHRDPVRTDRRG